MQALDTLNKKDLGECKTMITAPKGVDDVFAAVVVLLAGVEPAVIVQKSGRVKEEHRFVASRYCTTCGSIVRCVMSLCLYPGRGRLPSARCWVTCKGSLTFCGHSSGWWTRTGVYRCLVSFSCMRCHFVVLQSPCGELEGSPTLPGYAALPKGLPLSRCRLL